MKDKEEKFQELKERSDKSTAHLRCEKCGGVNVPLTQYPLYQMSTQYGKCECDKEGKV